MFTIYILDCANQLKTEVYDSQDAADDAADRWEAQGCDIFINRLYAMFAKDDYDRRQKNQNR